MLILPTILFARNNEWARFSKNKYISSYAIQDSIHWIGTGVGLFKYNSITDSLQHILKVDNISTEKVNYITVSENGSVWFLVNKITLLNFDGKNWIHYISGEGDLPEGKITKIKTDYNNDLFIIIDNRLMKFDGENWFCYPKLRNNFGEKFRVNDIIVNKDIIWLHTTESIAAYHNWKWQELRLQVNDYYHYNKNECLAQDPEGTLLFNFQGRINSVVLDSIVTIAPLDIAEQPRFGNNFEIDSNGSFLIVKVSTTYSSMTGDAFYQRDVITYKIDGNKLIHLETTPDILKGDYGISQIEIDNNGTLWLHTRSNFFKFSDTKLKKIELWDLVMPIHEVSEGNYLDTIYPNYPDYSQDREIIGHGDLVDQQEEGHWTYTISNNKIMMEGVYEAGKRIGVWKKYFSNGSIKKEIEYKNGFRDGYYIDYYRSGSKWNEGKYSKGKRTGEWINWFDNGNIREKIEYENNIKNGTYKYYDYKNSAYSEKEFVNGNSIDEWNYFNSDGKPIYSTKFPTAIKQPDKLNENGNKQGLWVTFMWSNFTKCNSVKDATYYRIAEYDDGVPQGIVRDYLKNGTLQFEGKLTSEFPSVYDGKIKIYDALGRIKAEREYKNGKMHGIVKTVTNSVNSPKRTVEIEYKDGKKDGLAIIRKDDEVTNEGHFKNGLKSGNWVELEKDKMYTGEYVKGRRVGPWKTYTEDGLRVIRYNKKGEKIDPINLKEYYPTNILKVLEYKKVPVIINPVPSDTWTLKLSLSYLMNKIESEKECAPVVSTESTDWPLGKMSTIGREAMYMLQGFIDGKYPPTECSVTDFNPKVKYYKKWWQKYQNDLKKE